MPGPWPQAISEGGPRTEQIILYSTPTVRRPCFNEKKCVCLWHLFEGVGLHNAHCSHVMLTWHQHHKLVQNFVVRSPLAKTCSFVGTLGAHSVLDTMATNTNSYPTSPPPSYQSRQERVGRCCGNQQCCGDPVSKKSAHRMPNSYHT